MYLLRISSTTQSIYGSAVMLHTTLNGLLLIPVMRLCTWIYNMHTPRHTYGVYLSCMMAVYHTECHAENTVASWTNCQYKRITQFCIKQCGLEHSALHSTVTDWITDRKTKLQSLYLIYDTAHTGHEGGVSHLCSDQELLLRDNSFAGSPQILNLAGQLPVLCF